MVLFSVPLVTWSWMQYIPSERLEGMVTGVNSHRVDTPVARVTATEDAAASLTSNMFMLPSSIGFGRLSHCHATWKAGVCVKNSSCTGFSHCQDVARQLGKPKCKV